MATMMGVLVVALAIATGSTSVRAEHSRAISQQLTRFDNDTEMLQAVVIRPRHVNAKSQKQQRMPELAHAAKGSAHGLRKMKEKSHQGQYEYNPFGDFTWEAIKRAAQALWPTEQHEQEPASLSAGAVSSVDDSNANVHGKAFDINLESQLLQMRKGEESKA